MLVRGASIVAAAAAVVAVVLGVQVHHLHGQVSALQSNRLSAVERSALADPSTKTIELAAGSAADAPSRKVTVVLTKSGTGFVEAGALDALPSDQTYQLWAVIGDQTISLGLLGSQPSVVPFSVAGNADVSAFAITAERAGGVVHSTHQPVVAGEVTV
jgi:anti-sigma-K factor RskA